MKQTIYIYIHNSLGLLIYNSEISHLLGVIIRFQNTSKSMHNEFPVVEHLSEGKVLKDGQT
jgi:hypothetical protein